MASAKAKLYYTSSEYISRLPLRNGNIIFAPDANTLCLDMGGQRFTYTTIRTFETDAARQALQSPTEGYYFVEATNTFWRYTGAQWRQATPSNLNPVVYGVDVNSLPAIGKSETLYYTDDGIYHWKNNKYNIIGNVNTWDVL